MYDSDMLARNITSLIDEKGITIYRLAKSIDVPKDTILKITNGTTKNPSIKILYAIADYFGCTLDDLVGRPTISESVDSTVNIKILEASLDILQKELEEQKTDITLLQWWDALQEIYASMMAVSSHNVGRKRKQKPS